MEILERGRVKYSMPENRMPDEMRISNKNGDNDKGTFNKFHNQTFRRFLVLVLKPIDGVRNGKVLVNLCLYFHIVLQHGL